MTEKKWLENIIFCHFLAIGFHILSFFWDMFVFFFFFIFCRSSSWAACEENFMKTVMINVLISESKNGGNIFDLFLTIC